MRKPRLPAVPLAIALALAAAAAPVDAQRVPAPHVLATLPGTTERPAMVYGTWLTRDRAGRLYLGTGSGGVTVYAPGGGPGRRLEGSLNRRDMGGTPGWMGDTLTISSFRRWEMVGPDGGNLGCHPLERWSEFDTQLFDVLPLAGGLYAGNMMPPWPQEAGDALVVARGTRQSEVVRTLARRPPLPESVKVPEPWSGGGTWVVDSPLFAVPEWSVADDGGAAVVVDQAAPAGPGAQTVRVSRLRMSGDTVYSVALRVPALAVSEAWRERQIREWLEPPPGIRVTLRDPAAAFDAFRRIVRFPAYHPPVAGVLAGVDGSAWLRLASDGDLATWVRLDSAGAERERVALPAAFQATYADGDGVWGVLPAVDGSARVVQFPDARPFADRPLELLPEPEPEPNGSVNLPGGCPAASR